MTNIEYEHQRRDRTGDLIGHLLAKKGGMANILKDAYDRGFHDGREDEKQTDAPNKNEKPGVWIYEKFVTHNLEMPFWSVARCSKCNGQVDSIFDHYVAFPYCPKCGHKMDTTGYYHADKYVNTASYVTALQFDQKEGSTK